MMRISDCATPAALLLNSNIRFLSSEILRVFRYQNPDDVIPEYAGEIPSVPES